MSENNYESLIAENTRRKFQANRLRQALAEAEAKLAAKDKELAAKDKELAEFQEKHEKLETEYEEFRAGLDENELVQEIDRLQATIFQRDISDRFTKEAGGSLADGVTFDAVTKNIGLDLKDIDPESIDDKFISEIMAKVKTSAPYLLRPVQSGPEQTAQQGPSQEAQAARRRLPTFSGATSGGGAPPPAEVPMSAERLRDPADAVKRAAEARASRSQAS